MVLHVAERVRAVAGSVTLVGAPERYRSLGLSVIPDLETNLGPLGGLAAALNDASADRILAVACDMPCLQPALLELLFQTAESTAAQAVVPVQPDGRKQPLCAVYSRDLAAAFVRALAQGRRRAGALLDKIDVAYLHPPDYLSADPNGENFLNVNDPSELQRTTSPQHAQEVRLENMKVHYTGRHVTLGDEDKERAQTKFDKIHRILGQGDLEAHVICSMQGADCEAEVTLHALHHTLVVTGQNSKIGRALGQALDKLEKQAVKSKHKLVDTRRPQRQRGEAAAIVQQAAAGQEPEAPAEDRGIQIIEGQGIEAKPMSLEGARLALEDRNLDQITFQDVDSNSACVLLRRRDGNLEVVRLS